MDWVENCKNLLQGQPRMRERRVVCANPLGLHRMAYTEWGEPDNPRVVVCVHGLTRNGRDFDDLAQSLCRRYRVICPDVVGRGRSDRLPAGVEYGFPQYVADMMVLLARLDVENVAWVGTSMGGLIGMIIASQEYTPISRLVLNDVGPEIANVSLQRIAEYLGNPPVFPDFAAAERYLRMVGAPFGPLADEKWQQMTASSVRQRPDGVWALIYDPQIAAPFARLDLAVAQPDLWPLYDRIRCPTLAIRGSESDLLTRETFAAMGRRGPAAQLVEIPGVGHAPMFMDEAQIRVVTDFLAVV